MVMKIQKIRSALPLVNKTLKSRSRFIYDANQLRKLLKTHRTEWHLPQSLTLPKFIDLLNDNGILREVTLDSPYTIAIRYVYGQLSPYALAESITASSYLSHGTAAFLHGLLVAESRRIYVNKEQSKKPKQNARTMTQEGIDAAFGRRQRQSQNVFRYDSYELVILNGKNTDHLQVHTIKGPGKESLRVTSLERTLIDMAVRPSYSGGVRDVLTTYRNALGEASILRMYRILEQLDYLYPYHQSIGFYLTVSGFPKADVAVFKRLPINFKFYLDYDMQDMAFDTEWQIFYPRHLGTATNEQSPD